MKIIGMHIVSRHLLAAGIAVLCAGSASAQVSLNSTRVTAADEIATAEFYKQAFGMHEVNRINMAEGHVELMLNFGNNVEEAKANPAAQVVIMHSDAPSIDDPVAHVIFNVDDANATAAAIVAAGGTMEREPFEYANTGIFIGLAIDPAGNHLELLQQPKP
jgi:predicted enzyme related to lactoylglutathione lyase